MPIVITVPELGESVPDAKLAKWLKQEGDPVEADEPVVELETDKISFEVPAYKGGTLIKLLVQEGESVAVGQKLAIVQLTGENIPKDQLPELAEMDRVEIERLDFTGDGKKVAAKREEAKKAEVVQEEEAAEERPARAQREEARPKRAPGDEVRTSPAVRKLAREHGIELTQIEGTGKGGRITKEDVDRYLQKREEVPAEAPPERPPLRVVEGKEAEERISISTIRRKIADHMVRSVQTSPHVTTVDEADMSRIVDFREKWKDQIQEEHGVRLTYTPFFVKATIGALHEYPIVNSSWDEEKEEIVLHKYYHIGVAVATDRGLIVPVIRHADRKGLVQIAAELIDLAERARANRLKLEEIQRSTFTITNAGVFGAILSTPIINQPNAAILGTHAIQDRPVVRHEELVIRPMIYFGLSFDHRIVDGAEASQFLRRLCELLEEPEGLLL